MADEEKRPDLTITTGIPGDPPDRVVLDETCPTCGTVPDPGSPNRWTEDG